VWALGLAVAAARTTNPLVLGLLIAAVCLVVALRRADTPWARAFRLYAVLGATIVALRTAFRIVFAGGGPTVLFTLPRLAMPESLGGVSCGGPVSAEALASGFYGGLQLATMVVCVGAANALANPKRLLAAVPGALEELGAVLTVAVSVFPQLAQSVERVNRARALRGGAGGRWRVVRQVLMPVLVDALDRSVELAAAMDARGYGRRAALTTVHRRVTTGILLTAVGALAVSAYALLDTSGTSAWVGGPLLASGAGLACVGLWAAGRRSVSSRYRPDPWGWLEWVAAASGIAAAAILARCAATDPVMMFPAPIPQAWPAVTGAVVLAGAIAALPGIAAPPPPLSTSRGAP
jgi:energy-coupling factor transport system permease protein